MKTVREAIDKAVADKNDIIFTVSPSMMTETHKAAALNPNVRFLNCSVGGTASSVRCYQGKFYEASFFKSSIVFGGFDPFTGELRSQDGTVIQEMTGRGSGVSLEQEKMETSRIAFMDWLNENIDGELPAENKS